MAEIRKGIGKLAGSGLGKAGAELAGKEVGKEVEGEVTKVTSKVAGKKAGRAVGKAVGDATGEVVGDLAKDVLSTEVGQNLVGEIAGPHPGRAICSFWQGTTEIVLRVLALLASMSVLLTAAVAIGVARHDKSIDDQFLNSSNTTQQELSRARSGVYGCAGYVIVIALLAIIIELLLIGIRWCNIGAVNLAISVFLMLDIILSGIFTFVHAVGIGAILYWIITFWNLSSTLQALRYSLVVCAVVSVLSVILYIILAVWSTLYRAKEWNKKVVKYTVKQVEHELAHKAKHAIEEKLKPIKSAL